MLDDIDRLPVTGICEVFEFLRLSGNLPNIYYLIAFDRDRVETALTDDKLYGRGYLDKILSHPFDLPEIPAETLDKVLAGAVKRVLQEEPMSFDETYARTLVDAAWKQQRTEIVMRLIRNMRDVRRYIIALRCTMIEHKELEIDLDKPDVLTLESVRLFAHDLYECLCDSVDLLTFTEPSKFPNKEELDKRKRQLKPFIEKGKKYGNDEGIGQAIIDHIFAIDVTMNPEAIRNRLNSGHVSNRLSLRRYLEKVNG